MTSDTLSASPVFTTGLLALEPSAMVGKAVGIGRTLNGIAKSYHHGASVRFFASPTTYKGLVCLRIRTPEGAFYEFKEGVSLVGDDGDGAPITEVAARGIETLLELLDAAIERGVVSPDGVFSPPPQFC